MGKGIYVLPLTYIRGTNDGSPINVGDIVKFSVEPDNNLSDINYTFKSSNEKVCKVDGDKIIAVGEGTAEIIACTEKTEFYKSNVRVYNSTITTTGDVSWLIPQKVKIGYMFSANNGAGRPIARASKDKYGLEDMFIYGSGVEGIQSFSIPHSFGLNIWCTENGYSYINSPITYATKPGVVNFHSVDGEYSVTVEEPIISTNEKSSYVVGSSLDFKSSLENTLLTNESFVEYKKSFEEYIKGRDSYCYNGHKIIYEPSFTIIEGAECVKLSDGDFSNTLIASENMKFVKAGTVKIRVRYTQLDTCNIVEPTILYSPEKIVTIKVTEPSVSYSTHVQDIGWQEYMSNGALSGTTGQAKRLEAIRIKLTGELANKYDVYYKVHAEYYGWLSWAKNGQSAGTAGYGKRLEGIQIKLVRKGQAAPGNTNGVFISR